MFHMFRCNSMSVILNTKCYPIFFRYGKNIDMLSRILTASLNIITSIIALSDKKEDIAHIFRFVGMLDALCSIAILREKLPYWATPHPFQEKACTHKAFIIHSSKDVWQMTCRYRINRH